MQTHKDVWWSVADQFEYAYFRGYGDPYPFLEFTPWPIKVAGLIFPDGTTQFTAGGGGGGGVAILAGPGISVTQGVGTVTISNTFPQSPWQSSINGNGFNLSNVGNLGVNGNVTVGGSVDASQFLLNGAPFTGVPQTPWQSTIDANFHSLINAQIISGASLALNSSVGTSLTGPSITVHGTTNFVNVDSPTVSIGQLSTGGNEILINSAGVDVKGNTTVNGSINLVGTGVNYFVNGVPFTGGAIVSTTPPPTTLTQGTLWYDSADIHLSVLQGGSWIQLTGGGGGGGANFTKHDVTSSRLTSTTYTNTTGVGMFVTVWFNSANSSSLTVSVNGGTIFDYVQGPTGGGPVNVIFPVPAGGTYAVVYDLGAFATASWNEWW